jgi:hypothetical protein
VVVSSSIDAAVSSSALRHDLYQAVVHVAQCAQQGAGLVFRAGLDTERQVAGGHRFGDGYGLADRAHDTGSEQPREECADQDGSGGQAGDELFARGGVSVDRTRGGVDVVALHRHQLRQRLFVDLGRRRIRLVEDTQRFVRVAVAARLDRGFLCRGVDVALLADLAEQFVLFVTHQQRFDLFDQFRRSFRGRGRICLEELPEAGVGAPDDGGSPANRGEGLGVPVGQHAFFRKRRGHHLTGRISDGVEPDDSDRRDQRGHGKDERKARAKSFSNVNVA